MPRLLPVTAGGSTLVAQDDGYWLRLSPHVAGEMEATLLPLLMQKAGGGEVWCYGDAPAKVHIDVQHASAASAGADPAAVANLSR